MGGKVRLGHGLNVCGVQVSPGGRGGGGGARGGWGPKRLTSTAPFAAPSTTHGRVLTPEVLARPSLGAISGAELAQSACSGSAWSEKARLSCWFDEARPRGARRTASSSRGGAATIWFAGSSSSEIVTLAGSSFSSATGFGPICGPICPSAFVSCTACAHAGRRRIRNGADDFELKARGAGSGADGR